MTLMIRWQSSDEKVNTVKAVDIGCAVLEVRLAGSVIEKTIWHHDWSERTTRSEIALEIKRFLQYPDRYDLSVDLKRQGTAFCNRVWKELVRIPHAETISYSELADRVGSGARAVAAACRKNPFPGIIPCHRVVSSSGLGGFMGQKHGVFVELKRRLLEYEILVSRQQDDISVN